MSVRFGPCICGLGLAAKRCMCHPKECLAHRGRHPITREQAEFYIRRAESGGTRDIAVPAVGAEVDI